MPKEINISIKRQERSKRKLTGTTKGERDRNCVGQEIVTVGQYPSGQDKQHLSYLHVTKGRRHRVLPPVQNTLLPALFSLMR